MFTMALSGDILKYLQEKKEMKVEDIAKAMGTTSEHIQKIINKETRFTSSDIKAYLKNTNTQLWEFSCDGDLLRHFPDKIKKNILLCHEISKHIKKKR